MAANLYARVLDVADLMDQAADFEDEARLVEIIKAASQWVENVCGGRSFAAVTATRYFDGNGKRKLLLSQDDLQSVSSLQVAQYAPTGGALTYDLTLTADTDYFLYPANTSPKWKIELNDYSPNIGGFPVGQRRVKVTGVWGASDEWENTGLTGTLADGTDTTLTFGASADELVGMGEMLKLGSEQVYVASLNTGTEAKVERGCNGTTAAAQAGVSVYRRRFPAPVTEAVAIQAVRMYKEGRSGFSGQTGNSEYGGQFSALYPAIMGDLQAYRRIAVR